MRWMRITFLTLAGASLAGWLHYTMPDREVVRITGTEVIRTDFTGWNRVFYAQPDSGNADMETRDLRLINTVNRDGEVMVFRNEDTGFGWPPYFKLDSQDLQAEAQDLVSTAEAPRWVVLRHYGWRSRFLSIYPNAVTLREIDDPDVRLIPWLNIAILALLALSVWFVWRMVERLYDRTIAPAADRVAAGWAKLKDRAAGRRPPV